MELKGGMKRVVKQKYSILDLVLEKPTRTDYPEFDYEQLEREHLKKGAPSDDDDGDANDPFMDQDALEMVRRLNEKYGPKKDGKKSRKRRYSVDDFIDKGIGYDPGDSFIDDSEAYDEYVPSTIDFQKNGFYVNRGPLTFKELEDDVDDEDEDVEENGREDAIASSSETSDERKKSEANVARPATPVQTKKIKKLKTNGGDDTTATATAALDKKRRKKKKHRQQQETDVRHPEQQPTQTQTSSVVTVLSSDDQASPLTSPVPRRMIGAPPLSRAAALGGAAMKNKTKLLKKRVVTTDVPVASTSTAAAASATASTETNQQRQQQQQKKQPELALPTTPVVAPQQASTSATPVTDTATAQQSEFGLARIESPKKPLQPHLFSAEVRLALERWNQAVAQMDHSKKRLASYMVELAAKVDDSCRQTMAMSTHERARVMDHMAASVGMQRVSLTTRIKQWRADQQLVEEQAQAATSAAVAAILSPPREQPQSSANALPKVLPSAPAATTVAAAAATAANPRAGGSGPVPPATTTTAPQRSLPTQPHAKSTTNAVPSHPQQQSSKSTMPTTHQQKTTPTTQQRLPPPPPSRPVAAVQQNQQTKSQIQSAASLLAAAAALAPKVPPSPKAPPKVAPQPSTSQPDGGDQRRNADLIATLLRQNWSQMTGGVAHPTEAATRAYRTYVDSLVVQIVNVNDQNAITPLAMAIQQLPEELRRLVSQVIAEVCQRQMRNVAATGSSSQSAQQSVVQLD